MKTFMKKRVIVALSVLATLVVASSAYAYWTTTGSGTGSGSVSASNGTIVLHGTIDTALTPGATSAVHFTADNAGTSSLYVGSVHAVVSTDKPGCLVSDFTISDTVENQQVPAGSTGLALTGAGSIAMADTALNQDACKGAAITLTLSSN